MSSLPTKYDICGNWKKYSDSLKLGWWYPCYSCNHLTARVFTHKAYNLWICKDCIPSHDILYIESVILLLSSLER